MPFQSTSSLNAARPLSSSVTTNAPNQNQPAPPSQSTRLAPGVRLRRKLEDCLALADVAEILAGELLDVGGIVSQPVDRARELVGAPVQREEIALHRLQLAPQLGHLEHGAGAVRRQRDGDHRD